MLTHRNNLTILGICTLAVAALAGCSTDPSVGYTTGSQYREDIKTVAMQMFGRGKDVYRRQLEFRLTEAVVKRVQQDTPYRIGKSDTADTELRGEIRSVYQQILHYNPDTGRPREMEVVFRISFTWTDLRTGEVLAHDDNLLVFATYIPQDPFNESFFDGSEDLINRAASRIVESMEAPW